MPSTTGRTSSGYRDYPPEAIETLHFLRRAQALGFSLKEIGDVLPARYGLNASCSSVLQSLQHKVIEIDALLSETTRMRGALVSLIDEMTARHEQSQIRSNAPAAPSNAPADDIAPPARRRRPTRGALRLRAGSPSA
jgi:DNA-binding transcriptional MerR regulator